MRVTLVSAQHLLRNFYQGYLIDSIKSHVCSFQGTYTGLIHLYLTVQDSISQWLKRPLPYGSGLYKPVGLSGLEPPTSRLSGVRSNQLSYKPIYQKRSSGNGDEEIRTLDPLLARQVLSQLSYIPFLIWRPPALPHRLQCSTIGRSGLNRRVRDGYGCSP